MSRVSVLFTRTVGQAQSTYRRRIRAMSDALWRRPTKDEIESGLCGEDRSVGRPATSRRAASRQCRQYLYPGGSIYIPGITPATGPSSRPAQRRREGARHAVIELRLAHTMAFRNGLTSRLRARDQETDPARRLDGIQPSGARPKKQ